jgi:hypothetical protein
MMVVVVMMVMMMVKPRMGRGGAWDGKGQTQHRGDGDQGFAHDFGFLCDGGPADEVSL